MYLSYYNLKHKPFQISTDPGFLWLGEKHMEALATLRYGVMDNKGFLLLTGDVGTGKTTLINALLNTLDSDVLVAAVRDPGLQPIDFFNYTANAFGMETEVTNKGTFLLEFERFLNNLYKEKKKALLIIDEAQRIDQELLEEVRLLSNIEKTESKLLNIFFVGQIEFNDKLLLRVNRPIRQRITVNYNIEPLTERETDQYIKYRLMIARQGSSPAPPTPESDDGSGMFVQERFASPSFKIETEIFTDSAIKEIYNFSSGYPRLINIICDRALLTGFVEDAIVITSKHVKECAEELKIPYFGYRDSNSTDQRNEQHTSVKHSQNKSPNFEPYQLTVPIEIYEDCERYPQVTGENQKHENKGKEKYLFKGVLRKVMILGVALVLLGYVIASWNPSFSTRFINSIKSSSLGGITDINKKTATPPSPQERQDTGSDMVQVTDAFSAEQDAPVTLGGSSNRNTLGSAQTLDTARAPADGKPISEPKNSGKKLAITLDKLTLPFPDNATLPPLSSLSNLNMLVNSKTVLDSATIVITGYATSQKKESLNLRLSEEKSRAIKIYLIGRGVDDSKIETVGLGSQNPIAPNDMPSGKAANQRVEVEFR